MAERRDADVLEIVVCQLAEQLAVDVVGAENLGILSETDPAEPIAHVQVQAPPGLLSAAVFENLESLATTVIPRGFLNQLGFAMWTPTTRQKYSRTVTRYQTDLTDTEWRIIAPHLPKPCATGRPREWPMREIVNGIFYVMRAGCPWRLVPSDLPPWGTIYRWFAAWRDDGRFERINHALVMADRQRVGRDASPSGRRPPERQDHPGPPPARVRWREKGQRAQASRTGRHRRPRPRHRAPSGERPGPRWRRPAAQSLAPIIPLHRTRLRRCGLRWRARRRRHLGRPGDRTQGPQSNRLRRPAATLGRRALLRLDRAQRATSEGLRSHNSLRQSLPLRRLAHAPRASPRTISMSFKTASNCQESLEICKYCVIDLDQIRIGVEIRNGFVAEIGSEYESIAAVGAGRCGRYGCRLGYRASLRTVAGRSIGRRRRGCCDVAREIRLRRCVRSRGGSQLMIAGGTCGRIERRRIRRARGLSGGARR